MYGGRWSDRSKRLWLGVALGGLALVLAALHVVQRDLAPVPLEGRLNAALGQATHGLYHVRFDSLQVDLRHGTVLARGIVLEPDSVRLASERSIGALPKRLYHLSIGALEVGGLHRMASLFQRGLVADRVRVAGADVRIVQIGAEKSYENHFAGVAGEFEHVRWGGHSSPGDGLRFGFSDDFAFGAQSFERGRPDGSYRLRTGRLAVSTRDSSFTVSGFDLRPVMSDAEFRVRNPTQAYRYIATIDTIVLRGFRGPASWHDRGLSTRFASVDGMRIDIDGDMRHAVPNTRKRKMVNDYFQRIPMSLRIDTLRLQDGDVRYSHVPKDGTVPGTIDFGGLDAGFLNLTNDPQRMTEASPATVRTLMRLNRGAKFQVDAECPLLSPQLAFHYRIRLLDRLDLGTLNSMFPRSSGVEFSRGTFDSLLVDATARDDRATGTFRGIYHDLALAIVDKRTGKAGVGARIESFLANTFVIKSENRSSKGEPARVAPIGWPHPPDEPFFPYWWHSLRNGMFTLVGKQDKQVAEREKHPASR